MRTRCIYTLLLITVSSLLFAQNEGNKIRKLSGLIEVGYITGFGNINLKSFDSGELANKMNGRLIKTIITYKIHNNFRCGLGFGFQGGMYPSSRPFFLDLRASLNKPNSPFMKLETGLFLKDSKDLWHGGNFLEFGIGYQLKLAANSFLIISSSINHSEIANLKVMSIAPYPIEKVNKQETANAKINSMNFSIAFMF
jgi:hypothetical protein